MMEVKQNTTVDLNDLLTCAKDSGTDEVDDAVMAGLSDRSSHDLVNCNIIKTNDEINLKMDGIENGDADITSLIKDVDIDVSVDANVTVNSELEDALLADDDVLPEISNNKTNEPISSATDDILSEKAETSNSTTSSNNVRDPGDDLDTLLSKINDIVEDCIGNESENAVGITAKSDEAVNKIIEGEEDNNLNDESESAVQETNVAEQSNLIETEKAESAIDNIDQELDPGETFGTLIDKDDEISPALPEITHNLLTNIEEVAKEENKTGNGENDVSESETKINSDKDTNQSNRIDINNTTEINLNQGKTEESNVEIVQDSKITSNSNDVFETIKTEKTTKCVENAETANSPTALDSADINKSLQNNEEESEATTKKESTHSNEKTPNGDAVTSVNLENDDSDDEIVFYVDKPPEMEKPKEAEAKPLDIGVETTTAEKSELNEEPQSTEKKTANDDDDIVLLVDDDDEEVDQIKKKEQNNKETRTSQDEQQESVKVIPSTNKSHVPDEKDIVIDNSDNARDDFVTETSNENENEKSLKKTEVTETPEETNSNCSSSSNLLQEAKSVKNAADEPIPEEAENEEEEDDGDVELIESDIKDSETSDKVEDAEIPPAKRIRLSEDGEEILKKQDSSDISNDVESLAAVDKKLDDQEKSEKETNLVTTHSTLKRSRDVIEVEADEKSNDSKISQEGSNKKQKTDSLEDDVIISEIVDEIKDIKKSEDVKCEGDDKNVKAVPSYEPIRLYPAPKFGILKSELPISLDFLKKFRKSFDTMTKQDLEDLVLQKVVEAIIHRSEFSEMRELIEKQEKIISAHRTKISELSKQFRDLEMVHNRVVKDIEQRNSQFIMPVKITRAVGLQVYIPNKKSLVEPPSCTTGPNISSSPQRPVSSQASSTSSTSLTPPQRQLVSSQVETHQQRTTGTASSGPGNTSNVRRGCVQKITPIRPVPGANQTVSAGSTPISSAYRATPPISAATQPRILNKNATITQNSTAIQRARYLAANQDAQRMTTQQQVSRTPNMPSNSQRVVTNAVTQSKSTSSVATSMQRRPAEPLSSQTINSSSSIVDNYINTLTHLTGGNTAVSITPAKPKEKAVIDLTDEDETPAQSVASLPVTQIPGTQVPRRSLPAQNSSNSQLQYGRPVPPLGRIPPANQMANNKNRQLSSLQAQNKSSFTSISTPPGTSITRINVAPSITNAQRVKYSHPAPLPATPPQAFNPAWKLPPPRPTIRISNLDNGIVISWTMEESMDRHAECVSYQIYAYQETSGPPMVDSWRHVGDVKAMLLPMAVTLTQFQEGQRYYFAVRAVDCHQRYGPFSLPKTWS